MSAPPHGGPGSPHILVAKKGRVLTVNLSVGPSSSGGSPSKGPELSCSSASFTPPEGASRHVLQEQDLSSHHKGKRSLKDSILRRFRKSKQQNPAIGRGISRMGLHSSQNGPKSYKVSLSPGHYQVRVQMKSRTQPFRITFTAKKKSEGPPPKEHQPLYYGDAECIRGSPSLPRRIVHRLWQRTSRESISGDNFQGMLSIGPSTYANAQAVLSTSSQCKLVTEQDLKTAGTHKRDYRVRLRHRNGRRRWASLSCIYIGNESFGDASGGGESFGGYEGIEHLKRSPYTQGRSRDALHDSDEGNGGGFRRICTSQNCPKGLHKLENIRKSWHEEEAFVKQVVEGYFRDPEDERPSSGMEEELPVNNAENVYCSRSQTSSSDLSCSDGSFGYDADVELSEGPENDVTSPGTIPGGEKSCDEHSPRGGALDSVSRQGDCRAKGASLSLNAPCKSVQDLSRLGFGIRKVTTRKLLHFRDSVCECAIGKGDFVCSLCSKHNSAGGSLGTNVAGKCEGFLTPGSCKCKFCESKRENIATFLPSTQRDCRNLSLDFSETQEIIKRSCKFCSYNNCLNCMCCREASNATCYEYVGCNKHNSTDRNPTKFNSEFSNEYPRTYESCGETLRILKQGLLVENSCIAKSHSVAYPLYANLSDGMLNSKYDIKMPNLCHLRTSRFFIPASGTGTGNIYENFNFAASSNVSNSVQKSSGLCPSTGDVNKNGEGCIATCYDEAKNVYNIQCKNAPINNSSSSDRDSFKCNEVIESKSHPPTLHSTFCSTYSPVCSDVSGSSFNVRRLHVGQAKNSNQNVLFNKELDCKSRDYKSWVSEHRLGIPLTKNSSEKGKCLSSAVSDAEKPKKSKTNKKTRKYFSGIFDAFASTSFPKAASDVQSESLKTSNSSASMSNNTGLKKPPRGSSGERVLISGPMFYRSANKKATSNESNKNSCYAPSNESENLKTNRAYLKKYANTNFEDLDRRFKGSYFSINKNETFGTSSDLESSEDFNFYENLQFHNKRLGQQNKDSSLVDIDLHPQDILRNARGCTESNDKELLACSNENCPSLTERQERGNVDLSLNSVEIITNREQQDCPENRESAPISIPFSASSSQYSSPESSFSISEILEKQYSEGRERSDVVNGIVILRNSDSEEDSLGLYKSSSAFSLTPDDSRFYTVVDRDVLESKDISFLETKIDTDDCELNNSRDPSVIEDCQEYFSCTNELSHIFLSSNKPAFESNFGEEINAQCSEDVAGDVNSRNLPFTSHLKWPANCDETHNFSRSSNPGNPKENVSSSDNIRNTETGSSNPECTEGLIGKDADSSKKSAGALFERSGFPRSSKGYYSDQEYSEGNRRMHRISQQRSLDSLNTKSEFDQFVNADVHLSSSSSHMLINVSPELEEGYGNAEYTFFSVASESPPHSNENDAAEESYLGNEHELTSSEFAACGQMYHASPCWATLDKCNEYENVGQVVESDISEEEDRRTSGIWTAEGDVDTDETESLDVSSFALLSTEPKRRPASPSPDVFAKNIKGLPPSGKPPPSPRHRSRDTSLSKERSRSTSNRRSHSASSVVKHRMDVNISIAGPRSRRASTGTSQESLYGEIAVLQQPFDGVKSARWTAERKRNEGNAYYKKKEYKEALKLYTHAIELCPECAAYYSNRSACYMMLGRYSEALSDAREAVRLDPSFIKGYIRVAKCHIALGDPTAALSVLREAKEVDPGNRSIREEMNNATSLQRSVSEVEKAIGKNDYRTAIFHLDRCLEVAVGCRNMKVAKAEYLVFLKRFQDAEEIVTEILQFDSTNVDAIYVRGMCLHYQDHPDLAFTHFLHVLRLAPDHQKAKSIYKKAKLLQMKKEEGNAAFKKGQFSEAYTLYTEALSIDPLNKNTNSKLYFNRATAAAKNGLIEQAINDCTAAINLDSSYIKAYKRRAKCYEDTEKYEDCARDYEQLYKLDPSEEHKRLLQEAKIQLKRSKRKDYYKILGISKTATDDEIKKAYRKLALLHHPDRHANASPREKSEHEIKFKEIGEAYAVLTDPKKRSQYDRGQDLNEFDGAGFPFVDPEQVFQEFFGDSLGGSKVYFGANQGFSGTSFSGFPGGFHFQFG